MPLRYNYYKFRNFYLNPHNVQEDPEPKLFNYFDNFKSHQVIKNKYITINDIRLYVDTTANGITFTIYDSTDINHWDHHFHFGLKSGYKDNRNDKTEIPRSVIYFHKTVQDTTGKKPTNCYFEINQPIETIEDIRCLGPSTATYMGRQFNNNDLTLIKEIIQRPFRAKTRIGGKTRKYLKIRRRTKKRVRSI